MTARVALVTGGSRGIGREIALALAGHGCAVAVAARHRDQVEATAADARARGVAAAAIELDVTNTVQIERAVAATVDALGTVDILVNNAGIAESAPLIRTDLALWERHLRINATAPYLLSQAVLPRMLEHRWGRIINIASLAGLYGAPYVTAYTTSKHALVGFTRALAAEVSGKGVTVNAICPGYVATDMVWNGARNIAARTGKSYDDAVAAMARMNPGGRLIAPSEVAAVALRLVDDAITNGDAIVLDGSGPVPEPDHLTSPEPENMGGLEGPPNPPALEAPRGTRGAPRSRDSFTGPERKNA